MTEQSVACVVLAAGAGSRFRDPGHKLHAVLPETPERPAETVARRAIAVAAASAVGPVIVVAGHLSADELGIASDDRIDTIANPRWAEGQMTSVHAGIAAAQRGGASIVVVGLADQPGVTAEAWQRVAAAAIDGAAIAVATYAGRRANPVALRSEVWPLLATAGDEGARTLMRIRADLVVPVSCSGSPNDIDTVEDLRSWQNN